MVIKNCGRLLRSTFLPASLLKRGFAQVGHIISTPPRVKCSLMEKILHITFMYVVWLAPVAYFHSQIKVWKRDYIGVP
ncbi:hypothetical protein B5X24_HaOG203709 [Helicoverpa armigera]|uniref:Uncharacterized protein n=1 Tax=Helicoverpa armigera TaxID=29058 RepID=A0A2W1BU24_HELAM|nr:hypothetical protein B5X24_HaOG203709 [Helicoverpa armigera]